MKKKQIDKYEKICMIISLIYLISIIWINFNGKVFYNLDIYSDTYVAKLMYENKTIFPDNWIFGNQYYVIATPVISAIMYGFLHDSVMAMAFASCIMMAMIIICFVWCFKPFCQLKDIIIGIFCLSGAVILGSSASSYVNGLQILYTMASYYACYVIGILICLGVYFRIKYKKEISKLMICVAILINIALGIQSLRQMLVMNIPLLLLEGIELLRNREKAGKQTVIVMILFVSNFVGVIISKLFAVNQITIIDKVSLTVNPKEIINNFSVATKELLTIMGITFFKNGIKWIPLFLCAIFICYIVIKSILLIIRKRQKSALENAIIFCLISLICVYLVGIFLFTVRAIYYFVWYLLTVFCFTYYITIEKKQNIIRLLILCGVINYFCNFVPDFMTYHQKNKEYIKINKELKVANVQRIYFDTCTAPIIPAYSKDKILSGSIKFDFENKSKAYLYPVEYLKPKDVFDDFNKKNGYIVFTNWTKVYLDNNATKEYKRALFKKLKCIDTKKVGDTTYYFYEYQDDVLDLGRD